MNDKILKNAIMAEQLYKLDKEEKKQVIDELLSKGYSQRGLATELNIPHSTIHDWASGRQNNVGADKHISLNNFYLKISACTPKDIKDWGRLKMIQKKIEELLRSQEKLHN